MTTASKNNSANSVALNEYKGGVFKEVEELVLEGFPKTILEIDQLLLNERYSYTRLPQILPDINLSIPLVQQDEKPVVKVENDEPSSTAAVSSSGDVEMKVAMPATLAPIGTVSYNGPLEELMEETRMKLRSVSEDLCKVDMWIQLLIPRIEDGNNFGVSVQTSILKLVQTVEVQLESFLEKMSRYLTARAKIVAKYPYVEDYRRAIREVDEKQFWSLRRTLTKLRNHLAAVHDTIIKNLEKIKKPRTSNMDHMY